MPRKYPPYSPQGIINKAGEKDHYMTDRDFSYGSRYNLGMLFEYSTLDDKRPFNTDNRPELRKRAKQRSQTSGEYAGLPGRKMGATRANSKVGEGGTPGNVTIGTTP